MIYRGVQKLASPLPKVLVRRQRQIVRTLSKMAHSWAKKWMNLEPNYQRARFRSKEEIGVNGEIFGAQTLELRTGQPQSTPLQVLP